jgi:hypothetical protein
MNPPKKEDDDQPHHIVTTDPDPTVAVKEALTLAIKNLEEKIDERFQAVDKATGIAREELRDKLQAMQRTLEGSANERASANKDLVDQLAKANQVALTAALQTQKESAAKSELAMADMLKQLQNSFETSNKATNEKIDRLTSRLDTGEGRIGGAAGNRQDVREESRDARKVSVDNRTALIAILTIGTTVLGLLIGWFVGHK